MLSVLIKTLFGRHITDAGFTRTRAAARVLFSSLVLNSCLMFVCFAFMALDDVSSKEGLNVILNIEYLLDHIWVPIAAFVTSYIIISFMTSLDGARGDWSLRTLKRWESWYALVFSLLVAAWVTIFFSILNSAKNFAAVRSDILVQDELFGFLVLGCLAIFWSVSSAVDRDFNNKFNILHRFILMDKPAHFWTDYPESYLEDKYLNFFELCVRYSMQQVPEFTTTFTCIETTLKNLDIPANQAPYALAWWPATCEYLFPPDEAKRIDQKYTIPKEFPAEKVRAAYDKYLGAAMKSNAVEHIRFKSSHNLASRIRRQQAFKKAG